MFKNIRQYAEVVGGHIALTSGSSHIAIGKLFGKPEFEALPPLADLGC